MEFGFSTSSQDIQVKLISVNCSYNDIVSNIDGVLLAEDDSYIIFGGKAVGVKKI